MDEWGEEVFADLFTHYGVDMRSLPPRLILVLVRQLPPESRLATRLNDNKYAGWDRKTFLMADMYDIMNAQLVMMAKQSSKKPKQIPEPTPYPRPGVEGKKKRKKSNALLSAVRGDSRVVNPFAEVDEDIVPIR